MISLPYTFQSSRILLTVQTTWKINVSSVKPLKGKTLRVSRIFNIIKYKHGEARASIAEMKTLITGIRATLIALIESQSKFLSSETAYAFQRNRALKLVFFFFFH